MQFNKTFERIIEHSLKAGRVPMLIGEPGIGKSSWVEAYAAARHTRCFTLACNQLADKADLTGARPDKDADGRFRQVFYPHQVIADAVDYARNHPRENPILFLDEINRATPDITSEALSLPTMRAIGSEKLPDNLAIITAGNDKGNVTVLDSASITRFVPYHMLPDTDTFLAVHPDLFAPLRAVLEEKPDYLFCKDESESADPFSDADAMRQFTTPRTVAALSDFFNACTKDEIAGFIGQNGQDGMSLLEEIIEAHTGHTAFSFACAQKIMDSICDMEDTEADSFIKPDFFDALEAEPTRQDLRTAFSVLDSKEQSWAVCFALTDPSEHETLLECCADLIKAFTPDDMRKLFTALAAGKIDRANLAALLATGAECAALLEKIGFTAD